MIQINSPRKILILVPGPEAKGGIITYFNALEDHINIEHEYFQRGSRTWPLRKNLFTELSRMVFDIINFIGLIRDHQFSILQTNTSIGSFGLLRDSIFLWLARIYSIKTITFFHGLHLSYQDKIEKKYLWLFKTLYFKSSCFIVLSNQFRETLNRWGYDKPIYVETTTVSENMIKGLTERDINDKYHYTNDTINILFLARVEIKKGIYEAIDAFNLLNSKFNNLCFTIAGDGSELDNAREYVSTKNISNIKFVGFVKDDKKKIVFTQSHLLLFPSYSEGMPTSVLEAMAFGLPVVITAVGGLVDFFVNGEHGYITDSRDPQILAELIEKLINDPKLMSKIAINNYQYAQKNFKASQVAKRLEAIYRKFI